MTPRAVLKRQDWFEGLRFLASRAIFFYLSVFLLSAQIIDYPRIKFITQINILNNIRPGSYSYLIELANDPTKINPQQLIRYIIFYERMVKFFPDTPEALGMLGYAYSLLGNYSLGIKFYKDAIHLAPDMFWFKYNLGFIYFKNGHYREASEIFEQAVAEDPQRTLDFIRSSNYVYRAVFLEKGAENFARQTTQRLNEGYRQAYKMLVLSYHFLQDNSMVLRAAQRGLSRKIGLEDFFAYYAGIASFEKKDYAQALPYLDQAVKVNPDLPDVYRYKGLSLKALGREKESQEWLERSEVVFKLKGPSRINDGRVFMQIF